MEKTREDYLFEDYVAYLTSDRSEDEYDGEAHSLNGRLFRIFGKDRDAQGRFMLRVHSEVAKRNMSKSQLQKKQEDSRISPVSLENQVSKSQRDRALSSGDYVRFVGLCDETGYMPDGEAEEEAYGQGCFLIKQEREDRQ